MCESSGVAFRVKSLTFNTQGVQPKLTSGLLTLPLGPAAPSSAVNEQRNLVCQ